MANTTLVAAASTAISLAFGVMLAYPLARTRSSGAGLIAFTVAATYLAPKPLLFIPMADIIDRLPNQSGLPLVFPAFAAMTSLQSIVDDRKPLRVIRPSSSNLKFLDYS